MLAREDFNDDTKDAGELGAGHAVTTLYEIVPPGAEGPLPDAAPLKYQETWLKSEIDKSDEMMTFNFRYKPIGQDTSHMIEKVVFDETVPLEKTSDNYKFSASVAGFGILLRDSKF